MVRLVVNEDITEGIRARSGAKKSEAKTRAILSAVPDIMFQISRWHVSWVLCQQVERPFLPPEKFVGRKIAEVMPSDLAELAMHPHCQSSGFRRPTSV
jgi:hypothetical protein